MLSQNLGTAFRGHSSHSQQWELEASLSRASSNTSRFALGYELDWALWGILQVLTFPPGKNPFRSEYLSPPQLMQMASTGDHTRPQQLGDRWEIYQDRELHECVPEVFSGVIRCRYLFPNQVHHNFLHKVLYLSLTLSHTHTYTPQSIPYKKFKEVSGTKICPLLAETEHSLARIPSHSTCLLQTWWQYTSSSLLRGGSEESSRPLLFGKVGLYF